MRGFFSPGKFSEMRCLYTLIWCRQAIGRPRSPGDLPGRAQRVPHRPALRQRSGLVRLGVGLGPRHQPRPHVSCGGVGPFGGEAHVNLGPEGRRGRGGPDEDGGQRRVRFGGQRGGVRGLAREGVGARGRARPGAGIGGAVPMGPEVQDDSGVEGGLGVVVVVAVPELRRAICGGGARRLWGARRRPPEGGGHGQKMRHRGGGGGIEERGDRPRTQEQLDTQHTDRRHVPYHGLHHDFGVDGAHQTVATVASLSVAVGSLMRG